jgi:hypothetical protein
MKTSSRILFVCWTLILLSSKVVYATETYTNHNWVYFGISAPQTNFSLGGKILVSMVISNASETEHWLRPIHGDQCGPGFGEFQITEMISGKYVECKFSAEQRSPYSSSLDVLEGHRVESFGNNLAYGYGLTNAGVYIVQGIGRFSSNEPPILSDTFTVVTPPILIWVSPNTNAPPK